MRITEIRRDATLRELETRGTPMFPFAAYDNDIDAFITGDVPWHWHAEVEWMIVRKGLLQIFAGENSFTVPENDGIFVNSGVLHGVCPVEGKAGLFNTIVFDPQIIAGVPQSVYDLKYVRPVILSHQLRFIYLSHGTDWQAEMLDSLQKACQAMKEEKFGYEMEVRQYLSQAWIILIQHTLPNLSQKEIGPTLDEERIKKMMAFIQNHADESITVREIAEAGDIGESECFRSFRRNLHLSPIDYLNRYRLSMAAEMLAGTNDSISDVSSQMGFSSASYFTLLFRREFRCTPKEWRQKYQKN